ncbi:MAG TPA: hypothetical protein VFQ35_14135, partial [Polyangiaceae bacterium]|nr:hypothetical protein [Polyangiaceae bacterium]
MSAATESPEIPELLAERETWSEHMENDPAESPAPNTLSLPFLEALYADYLKDPASVPPTYRDYFAGVEHDERFSRSPRIGPAFRPSSVFNPETRVNGHAAHATVGRAPGASNGVSDAAVRQDRLDALVRAYRVRGHMIAK